MRYSILLISICFGLLSCNTNSVKPEIIFADNPVIAHRGAWKANDYPKNSIAALNEAIRLNCTGSEFDVRMTKDDILIVTHDADYGELNIESNTYEELAKHKLPNGETLPTLRAFITAGMANNTTTGLVCEIKPSKIEGRNKKMANRAVSLVKELNAEKYISYYISFSYTIVKEIKAIDSSAKVMYLDGSKPPKQLKLDSIDGLDYHFSRFKNKPEWVSNAKELNLVLNAWTVNKADDMDWLLANNFDYITSDEPELLFERLKKSKN